MNTRWRAGVHEGKKNTKKDREKRKSMAFSVGLQSDPPAQ